MRCSPSGTSPRRGGGSIPSPSVVHFRFGRQALESGAYRDIDTLLADLGETYARAVAAFGAAGCRCLQLDGVNLAMLCDPKEVEAAKGRGIFRADLTRTYAALINAALLGRPPGMKVAMHLCRGNFRSTWVASGGYEPVAEALFNEIGVDKYFLEYDSARAGGFEPLRFVPKGSKTVVLGLVTSKTGALESAEALERRIEEAARFVPLEQLALSPQCGFASTEEGNALTEAQQWAKLRLTVEVAERIWGRPS